MNRDTPGPVPRLSPNGCHDRSMATITAEEVRMPKLDGRRVALRGRVLPDTHARAVVAAREHGLSLSDYLGMLIDRDTSGDQSDPPRQTELPLTRSA